MITQKYEDVLFDVEGAYIHNAYIGFKEDYLALHSLLRRFQPKSIFEVGTNIGEGINVIATALPHSKIYSLDLDYETMKQNSLQYPLEEDGSDRVGSAAKFPYTQLRGDSLTFDYSKYKCEAVFCDGEHDFQHPFIETMEWLKLKPRIIIYHDADMKPVMDAIQAALKYSEHSKEYQLYRVLNTRIAYLLRK